MSETNGKHETPTPRPVAFEHRVGGRIEVVTMMPESGRLSLVSGEWAIWGTGTRDGIYRFWRLRDIGQFFTLPDLTPPRPRNLDGSLAEVRE